MHHCNDGYGFLPIPNCCRKMERRRSGSRGRIAVQSLPTPWVTVIHGRCRPGERNRQAAMRQQLRQRWPPIPWRATAIQALPTKKAATKCLNTAPSFGTVSSSQRGVVVARPPCTYSVLYTGTRCCCTTAQRHWIGSVYYWIQLWHWHGAIDTPNIELDPFFLYWIQCESLYNLVTRLKNHTLGVKIPRIQI